VIEHRCALCTRCMDETPLWADKAASQQLHVPCSKQLSLSHVAGRSTEGREAGGVLKNYTGTIVSSDRRSFAAAVLGSYSLYWSNKSAGHKRCSVHPLRDLQAILSTRESQAAPQQRPPLPRSSQEVVRSAVISKLGASTGRSQPAPRGPGGQPTLVPSWIHRSDQVVWGPGQLHPVYWPRFPPTVR
jgi:hypothetical protein